MADIVMEVGQVTYINGQRVRYVGDGKFEPAPEETMSKRFDHAGGPLSGQPVTELPCV
jgi:hypothetical protein